VQKACKFLLCGIYRHIEKFALFSLAKGTKGQTSSSKKSASVKMDEHLAQLLAKTHDKSEGPRKQAELDLLHAQPNPEFPLSLARIGAHTGVPIEIRQSALTYLRKFIETNWGPDEDEDGGVPQIPIPEPTKDHLRNAMLELVLSPEDERKVKVAAR
jgi:hypothetical protein